MTKHPADFFYSKVKIGQHSWTVFCVGYALMKAKDFNDFLFTIPFLNTLNSGMLILNCTDLVVYITVSHVMLCYNYQAFNT